MTATSETAFAKINLALHIRRRRPDGYHEIETLFAFAEGGDLLTADWDSDELGLALSGPFAAAIAGEDPSENLVARAIKAFAAEFDLDLPGGWQLFKALPVAAGIGGGSADAAAALRICCRQAGITPDNPHVMAIARALGADVPACMASVTARGDGRGDDLMAVEAAGLAGMPLLLVNPGVSLPTGPVFRAWDKVDRGPLASGDPLTVAVAGRNDLELPAFELQPVIGDVLAQLAACSGVVLHRMSGSGATCFALFETVASRDLAAQVIRANNPSWWCFISALR